MAYRGITARLPIGFQGFTGTQNPSQAGPGHFVFVEGAELDGGIIRKDGGASLYNSGNPLHGGLLDSFTKILVHGNGLDGSIALPDTNGVVNRLWTPAGNAQIDTSSSVFGGASILYDGTGDWFTAPDDSSITLGASDWTIEFWFNFAGGDGLTIRMAGQSDAGATNAGSAWRIIRTTGNNLAITLCFGSSANSLTGAGIWSSSTNPGWHHLAAVRTGNVVKLFVDGVQDGNDMAFAQTINDVSAAIGIGSAGSLVGSGMNGRLDEFRMSVGVARWDLDFTPPTAPYADYTTEPSRAIVADVLTKSNLHMDGTDAATTFPESSLFTRTWTANGNAQVDTAQSRFGGASLLLDGTGDYLSTPDHADFTLGSGDFTIEGWFNCTAATGTNRGIAAQADSTVAAATTSWFLRRNAAADVMTFGLSNGAAFTQVTGTTVFTNAVNTGWHHCAVTRSAGILRMFIDGVQEGGDVSANFTVNDTANAIVVGAVEATIQFWTGWIDEFRFVNGAAKWIVPFAPPTAAYSQTGSNGSLLEFGALSTNVQRVVAGIHWPSHTPGVSYNVIATDDGLILLATAGAFNIVGRSGLNALGTEPPPYFMFAGGEAVGANRKLMMFSSNNQAQVCIAPATTFANISAPPTDWSSSFPTFGALHVFRVFAGGNASDPHRLYYTGTTNHQDFAGAGSGTIAIFPGEGEKIIGAISFRGALIVWKYPQGVYVVITTDPTPANWRVDRLTKAIGGLNQLGIVQIENDVAFFDKSGNTHLLSATNEFGDVNTSNLSEVAKMGPFMRSSVQLANAQKSIGVWYPSKRQLWQAVCQLGSSENDLRIQTGFEGLVQQTEGQQNQGLPPRVFMSRRDTLLSLWLHPDPTHGIPKPMSGDHLGFVWYMDIEARNKNNTAYAIQFQTASTDLAFVDPALATKQKNGEFIELAYEPRGDWDLTVDIFWDDVYIQTVLFNMGGSGGTLGSFILDTDVLGTEGARSNRQRIEGSGRRLKIAAQNEGLNQDVSLAEFHLSFSVGDERIFE